jgi:hypothetical protein
MAKIAIGGFATAVAVQDGFGNLGTAADAVAALIHNNGSGAGSVPDLTDGMVLGDAESGDSESGITVPNIVGEYRKVPAVAASWTESADSFIKATAEGFAFSWVHQGNGASASSSPAVGEADLATIIPGLEAILECSGLTGTDGSANVARDYNPRASAIYTTWKLWHGTLAFVYTDCLIETLEFALTPGGKCIGTANIKVGTYDHTTPITGHTFPAVDYGVMASLAGPTVEGVGHTAFGQLRGFEDLVISISNPTETFKDSNIDVTGEFIAQKERIISATGRIFVDDTGDDDDAWLQLKSTSAPTNDLSCQIGTPATAENDVINAFKFELENLQPKDIKYSETGDWLVVELGDSKATSTTAGTEFQLTMN